MSRSLPEPGLCYSTPRHVPGPDVDLINMHRGADVTSLPSSRRTTLAVYESGNVVVITNRRTSFTFLSLERAHYQRAQPRGITSAIRCAGRRVRASAAIEQPRHNSHH